MRDTIPPDEPRSRRRIHTPLGWLRSKELRVIDYIVIGMIVAVIGALITVIVSGAQSSSSTSSSSTPSSSTSSSSTSSSSTPTRPARPA